MKTKKAMTNMEIKMVLNELPMPGRIEKIYNRQRELVIVFSNFKLYICPFAIYMTSDGLKDKSNFAEFLRKHLKGRKASIRQHSFDRIVEIITNERILILEIFHRGNFILCDSEMNIIRALENQQWKDRKIFPREKYIYPKKTSSDISQKIVAVLAKDGFGKYAEEMLQDAGIDKDTPADKIETSSITRSFMERKLEPAIFYKDGEKIDVTPFPMKFYSSLESKKFPSFSAALEEFYRPIEEKEFIKSMQRTGIKKFIQKAADFRSKGEIIFRNHNLVISALESIKKREVSPIIKGLKGQNATLILEGQEITIDIKKSAEENAGDYFDKSKIFRKKAEKAEAIVIKPPKIPVEREKREWYHKFRWFVTSTGHLVVAGKDAITNEILIKKNLSENDIVFHADIHGASFVVIKNMKDPLEQALKEAAQFAACNSKAWPMGLGSVDVYWVRPDQVDKTSTSHLSKGSFTIHGKKNYYRNVELRFAIGFKEKLVSGPVESVSSITKNYVVLQPGDMPAEKLGVKIKKILGTDSKDIPSRIPGRKAGLIS